VSSHHPQSPAPGVVDVPKSRETPAFTDHDDRPSAEERPAYPASTANDLVADVAPPTRLMLRTWLTRCGEGHGITAETVARDLRLPPAVIVACLERGEPPRWLLLALAGIAIARGIPADELNWMLDGERNSAVRSPRGHSSDPSPLSRNSCGHIEDAECETGFGYYTSSD
jgi:hypothetical protein